MKKNLGTIAGITVNTTENVISKVKTTVPEKKDASKDKLRKGWKSIKDAYVDARLGEEAEVIETEVPVSDSGFRAFRMGEITTGGK